MASNPFSNSNSYVGQKFHDAINKPQPQVEDC